MTEATIPSTQIAFSPVDIAARKKLEIKPGDTVRVHQKIEEKGKTRIQVFEGLVLAVKHGKEPGATFTVRKVSSGVGVEKIFPLYSPVIDKIEVTKRSKVRRAKLYYIREKVAKQIRSKIKNVILQTPDSTADYEKENAEEEQASEKEEEVKTEEAPTENTEEQTEEVSEEKEEQSEEKEEEKTEDTEEEKK